jgi:hypothetical protein
MMNNPLVGNAAKSVAQKSLDSALEHSYSHEITMQQVFHTILSRPASQNEIARCVAFLNTMKSNASLPDETSTADLPAWTALCQVLLSSNEFVYLD